MNIVDIDALKIALEEKTNSEIIVAEIANKILSDLGGNDELLKNVYEYNGEIDAHFECNIEEAKMVLDLFEPNVKEVDFEHGSTPIHLDTPYKIEAESNYYNGVTFKIKYHTYEFSVEIKIKADDFHDMDVFTYYDRKPTDSESVYYCNYTDKEKRNATINTATFKKKSVLYYGGSSVLVDVEEINRIINIIKGE